ncbi:MAG: carboxypeptidase-like regulatory domain-containing protein [Planctomycetota bacterium]|nr:carboxypeptidase-like regulatory domain-containing protein [Planctomycetota bacterium]
MRTSHWIGGSLIVLIGLALSLTYDPLGFMDTEVDPPIVSDYADEALGTSGGLQGRGRVLPGDDPAEWEGEAVGRLVLSLGDAELHGSVVNAAGPLRFARVRVALAPPYHQLAVRTRKDGTWQIAGLSEGTHEVHATAEDHIGRTVTAPPLAATQTVQVAPIELDPRGENRNAIVVKVTDAFGRPLAGARVLATTMPWDLHLAMGPDLAGIGGVFHKFGTTDENGRTRLGPLPPETYSVVAMAPGYVNSGVDSLVVSGNRERTIGVKLIEGVTVRGRVLDDEGNGVGGAIVMGFAQPSFASSLSATSAEDGTFVLEGLRKGGYMFVAFEEKHGSSMVPGQSPGSIDIKLSGAGTVKGRAIWADGTPVAQGQVRPFKIGPFQYVYSQVHALAADGTFTFDVPAGDWNCRLQASDGTMLDGTMVTVAVGGEVEVEIKLAPSGVARGVVTDEQGAHITGAEVFVMQGGFPETPSREQYARTDGEGRFEVRGLPLSTLDLHVRHSEYADTKVRVTPTAADSAKEVTVRLGRGASVVGRVLDSENVPVVGEQVNLAQRGAWFDARNTFTDVEGAYRFDAVTEATYMVTTGPFEQGARGLSRDDIAVGPRGVVTVDFVSPAAGGAVTGLVRLAGKPVPAAQVTLTDARGPERAVNVSTDETGRFAAQGLQFGRVRVTARAPDGLTGALTTQVGEGDATDITVDIGSATVSARIVDARGMPAAGCWINIELVGAEDEGWGRVKDNGNSDADGLFRSKGLQAGTYTLRSNRVDFAQFRTEPFTLAESESKDLGTLRMLTGVVLQGTVRDDAGAPVEKATVSLRDLQGRQIQLFSMATSGSDGRYAMQGVEAGRYIVHTQAAGHAPDDQEVEVTDAGATVDAELPRGGAVRVILTDPDGAPVTGANVKLFDEKGVQVTRTISLANFDTGRRHTDGGGRAHLDDLPAGTFVVRAELTGWTLVGGPGRVRVEPGGLTEVRMTMERAE